MDSTSFTEVVRDFWSNVDKEKFLKVGAIIGVSIVVTSILAGLGAHDGYEDEDGNFHEAWEAYFVLNIVVMCVSLMAVGYPPEVTMLVSMVVCRTFDITTSEDAWSGFSSRAVVSVGLLFVVAEGVYGTGILDVIMQRVLGSPSRISIAQIRLLTPVMIASAILNNTPVVALMIPVIDRWCQRTGLPKNKLLMPLSFASMLGGCLTLVGSSTNLVIDTLTRDYYDDGKVDKELVISMFDMTAPGLLIAGMGVLFMLATSPFLLPDGNVRATSSMPAHSRRRTLFSTLSQRSLAHFIGEATSARSTPPQGTQSLHVPLLSPLEDDYDSPRGSPQPPQDNTGRTPPRLINTVSPGSLRPVIDFTGHRGSEEGTSTSLSSVYVDARGGSSSESEGGRLLVDDGSESDTRSSVSAGIAAEDAGSNTDVADVHTDPYAESDTDDDDSDRSGAPAGRDHLGDPGSAAAGNAGNADSADTTTAATAVAQDTMGARTRESGNAVARPGGGSGFGVWASSGENSQRVRPGALPGASGGPSAVVAGGSSGLDGTTNVRGGAGGGGLHSETGNQGGSAGGASGGSRRAARQVSLGDTSVLMTPPDELQRSLSVDLQPSASDPSSIVQSRDYFVFFVVENGSKLAGSTLSTHGLHRLDQATLLRIDRGSKSMTHISKHLVLQGGDRLLFCGTTRGIRDLRRVRGLMPASHEQIRKLGRRRRHRRLAEVVLSKECEVVGKTIASSHFLRRFHAAVLAIRRASFSLIESYNLGQIMLEPGDTLLIECFSDFFREHENDGNFLLVSFVDDSKPPRYGFLMDDIRASMSLLLLVLMVGLSGAGFVSLRIAATYCSLALIGLKCLTVEEAWRAVDGRCLLTIAAAFGLGAAVDRSGAGDMVGRAIVDLVEPLGNVGILGAIYIMTCVIGCVTSNNATVIIMFPVALTAYRASDDLSLERVVYTLFFASSASFATPISYQTNMMIVTPGNYSFFDFFRFGVPLTFFLLFVTVGAVMLYWS
eukprot:Rmarinus@m.4166